MIADGFSSLVGSALSFLGFSPSAPAQSETDRYDGWDAFHDRMKRERYVRFDFVRPSSAHEMVQFHRFEWDAPEFLAPRELPPEANSYGLWWRPLTHSIDGDSVKEIHHDR